MAISGHGRAKPAKPQPLIPPRQRRRHDRLSQPVMKTRVIEKADKGDRRTLRGKPAQHRPHHRGADILRMPAQFAHVETVADMVKTVPAGQNDGKVALRRQRRDALGRPGHGRRQQKHIGPCLGQTSRDGLLVPGLGPKAKVEKRGAAGKAIGQLTQMRAPVVAETGGHDQLEIGHHAADHGHTRQGRAM